VPPRAPIQWLIHALNHSHLYS